MKPVWHRQFKDWRTPEVERVFSLVRVAGHPDFDAWIGSQVESSQEVDGRLEVLRSELLRFASIWNETELMSRFIGPLLSLVQFWGADYNLFHGRQLSLMHEDRRASGAVDGMVASGLVEPERPFFFLHEYKRSQGYEADPQGQLLIAMVAAQRLNDDEAPLYGCYVVGPYWRFIHLLGSTYAESQGYDATDAGELRVIWAVLQETKRRIEEGNNWS